MSNDLTAGGKSGEGSLPSLTTVNLAPTTFDHSTHVTTVNSRNQSTLNFNIHNHDRAAPHTQDDRAAALMLHSLINENLGGNNGSVCGAGGGDPPSHAIGTTNQAIPEVKVEFIDAVPVLPATILPVKVSDINYAHCDKHFGYYWIFDQSTRLVGCNQYGKTHSQVEDFMKKLTRLHHAIMQQGKVMTIKKWVEGFREDGFLVNGQPPNNLSDVKRILSSAAMRKAYEDDPLVPFGYTMRNIYSHTQDKSLVLWFDDTLRSWLRSRDDDLKFDFHPRGYSELRTKSRKHSILTIGTIPITELVKSIKECEDKHFHASIRTKLPPSMGTVTGRANRDSSVSKGEEHDAGYSHLIIGDELKLLNCNPLGISVYLRVLRSKFPGLKRDSDLNHFRKLNRKEPFLYGGLFVFSAISNGIRREDAVKHVTELYRSHRGSVAEGNYDHCAQVQLPSIVQATPKCILAPDHVDARQMYSKTGQVENNYQATNLPPHFHDFMRPPPGSGQHSQYQYQDGVQQAPGSALNDWSPVVPPPPQQMAPIQFEQRQYPNQYQALPDPMAYSNSVGYPNKAMAHTHIHQSRHLGNQHPGSGGVSPSPFENIGMASPGMGFDQLSHGNRPLSPTFLDYRPVNEGKELGSFSPACSDMGMEPSHGRSEEVPLPVPSPVTLYQTSTRDNQEKQNLSASTPLCGRVEEVRLSVPLPVTLDQASIRDNQEKQNLSASTPSRGREEEVPLPVTLDQASIRENQEKQNLSATTQITPKTPKTPYKEKAGSKSSNVNREWAKSLIGLELMVPGAWWPSGPDDKEVYHAKIEDTLESSVPKECLFSIFVEADGEHYPMDYVWVKQYAREKQPDYASYKLPMNPIFDTTPTGKLGGSQVGKKKDNTEGGGHARRKRGLQGKLGGSQVGKIKDNTEGGGHARRKRGLQVQPTGKVVKGFCPHVYICRMARGHCSHSECRAAMCYNCHNRLVDDSKSISNQEQTAKNEKKRRDELETIRLGKLLRGKARLEHENAGKKKEKASKDDARRQSSRSNLRIMSDQSETIHLVDENSCQHDDLNTWQQDAQFCYFKNAYRNGLIKRRKDYELLDMNCFKCGGLMPNGIQIED